LVAIPKDISEAFALWNVTVPADWQLPVPAYVPSLDSSEISMDHFYLPPRPTVNTKFPSVASVPPRGPPPGPGAGPSEPKARTTISPSMAPLERDEVPVGRRG
ncbi:hypothetical protein KM043_000115, partial [Ampulex compressa]